MKEFKIITGFSTEDLEFKMNEFAKKGFDLVPGKKVMITQFTPNDPNELPKNVFTVFMEKTIDVQEFEKSFES